jgi:iron complex transport system substrate-binding protein
VYFFRFDEIEDIPRAMRVLGDLAGRASAADSAASAFENELDRIRSGRSSSRPSVLFLISSEVLYSVGDGSYVNHMIEAAGGRSLTSDISSPAPVLNEEFVISQNPDIIIGTFGQDFSLDALLRQRPAWANLEAVHARRVYSVPGDLFHRPGPRVLEGIAILNDLFRDE